LVVVGRVTFLPTSDCEKTSQSQPTSLFVWRINTRPTHGRT